MRSRMSSIMGQIEPEHPRYLPLNLKKFLNLTVYTPASRNINQSAPNLVKFYVTIRSRMSSIMNLIRPELYGLFALEFANIVESVCLLPCIYKFRPINTKHGHNTYSKDKETQGVL